MEGSGPIERHSLHRELVERLRDMIVEGALPADEKIPEKDLTELFGVSRTPLREALKVLASEGLVKLTPNRGATVTRITEQDLDEVFPVMGVLEGLSGELACDKITDEEVAEIRRMHAEMVEHFENGDLPNYFRCNQDIHEAILQSSRNATLISVYRNLAGRVRRARYMANLSGARWQQAVEEHEAILKALDARDGQRLSQILRDHLKHKLETVRVWIRDTERGSGVADAAE